MDCLHSIVIVLVVSTGTLESARTVTVESSTCGNSMNLDKLSSATLQYVGGNVDRCKFELDSASDQSYICWKISGDTECPTSIKFQNETGNLLMEWTCLDMESSPQCTNSHVLSVIFNAATEPQNKVVSVRIYVEDIVQVEDVPVSHVDPGKVSVLFIGVIVSLSTAALIAMVILSVVCYVKERRRKEQKGRPKSSRDPFSLSPHDTELSNLDSVPYLQPGHIPGYQPSPTLGHKQHTGSRLDACYEQDVVDDVHDYESVCDLQDVVDDVHGYENVCDLTATSEI